MGATTDILLQQLFDTRGPLVNARLASEYESVMATAAVSALVVRPTTTAAITFWNGEPANGKSLVIDRVFSFNLVSTATAARATLHYCMHLDMAKPTNDITALRGTGDGREPNNSTVVVDVGATVLNDGWFPAGDNSDVSEQTGTLPGGNLQWEVNGRLVVPPRHAISLHVVSSKTTETFTGGASWWRMQL